MRAEVLGERAINCSTETGRVEWVEEKGKARAMQKGRIKKKTKKTGGGQGEGQGEGGEKPRKGKTRRAPSAHGVELLGIESHAGGEGAEQVARGNGNWWSRATSPEPTQAPAPLLGTQAATPAVPTAAAWSADASGAPPMVPLWMLATVSGEHVPGLQG